jgi:hypothetical protein
MRPIPSLHSAPPKLSEGRRSSTSVRVFGLAPDSGEGLDDARPATLLWCWWSETALLAASDWAHFVRGFGSGRHWGGARHDLPRWLALGFAHGAHCTEAGVAVPDEFHQHLPAGWLTEVLEEEAGQDRAPTEALGRTTWPHSSRGLACLGASSSPLLAWLAGVGAGCRSAQSPPRSTSDLPAPPSFAPEFAVGALATFLKRPDPFQWALLLRQGFPPKQAPNVVLITHWD